jgi:hypothetical protein
MNRQLSTGVAMAIATLIATPVIATHRDPSRPQKKSMKTDRDPSRPSSRPHHRIIATHRDPPL